MSATRLLTAVAACAITASASAQITDLTTWDFYYDNDPGPGALRDATTGSAAPNLAELNFLNAVPVPAGYDIGYSSINMKGPDGGIVGAGVIFQDITNL